MIMHAVQPTDTGNVIGGVFTLRGHDGYEVSFRVYLAKHTHRLLVRSVRAEGNNIDLRAGHAIHIIDADPNGTPYHDGVPLYGDPQTAWNPPVATGGVIAPQALAPEVDRLMREQARGRADNIGATIDRVVEQAYLRGTGVAQMPDLWEPIPDEQVTYPSPIGEWTTTPALTGRMPRRRGRTQSPAQNEQGVNITGGNDGNESRVAEAQESAPGHTDDGVGLRPSEMADVVRNSP